MIYVDECDPVGELEPSFLPRDVTIKRGVDAKEFYDLIGEIGRGKFGTVYKCREKSTGLEFAAKFVPIPKRDDRRNVEREVEIMNSLQHPLIIQLYDAYEHQKMMCVVLELIDGGELFDRVIDDEFVITERACAVVIRQVCQAMEFIHRSNILHLDLKPENILCLSKNGNRIKLIDFGLARRYDPDKRLQVLFGTPEFVAPEVVNFDAISFGTDMWSIGVICYVLLSGLSPFMGETDIATMANVTIAKYDFDDEAFNNVSGEALDFITKLLLKDINERMTASQCLEHRWLRTKPKPQIAPKPLLVPPVKLVSKSPSPDTPLESTKENLKNFIERWEDHPNSPYIFDSNARLISPSRDEPPPKRGSALSSRGCSPSPCESLSADVETNSEILSTGHNDDDSGAGSNETICADEQNEQDDRSGIKDYLHTFDRRNSDSNYVLKKSNSTEKMNLADEIKKLSDRLMILSALKSEINGNMDDNVFEESPPPPPSHTESTTPKKPELKPKPSELLMSQLSQGFRETFSSNESFTNGTKTRSTFKKTVTTHNGTTTTHEEVTESNTLEDRLKSIDELPTLSNRRSKNITISRNKSFSNGSISPPYSRWGAPWPVSSKRTKFRITQLSRDVPLGSPNSHRTIFLEEAATNTKDCLLHLLEKYDDVEKKRISCNSNGRHQSISVGWGGVTDNLEYQSINSINAFFKRHAGAGSSIKQMAAKMEATTSTSSNSAQRQQ